MTISAVVIGSMDGGPINGERRLNSHLF